MKVKDYIRSLSDEDMAIFFCQGGYSDFEDIGNIWCDKRQYPLNMCTGVSCEECTKLFMESDIDELIKRLEERKALYSEYED